MYKINLCCCFVFFKPTSHANYMNGGHPLDDENLCFILEQLKIWMPTAWFFLHKILEYIVISTITFNDLEKISAAIGSDAKNRN